MCLGGPFWQVVFSWIKKDIFTLAPLPFNSIGETCGERPEWGTFVPWQRLIETPFCWVCPQSAPRVILFFRFLRTPHLAMDQYLYIPFLVGWTSIYQLFWYTAISLCFLEQTCSWANIKIQPSFASRSCLMGSSKFDHNSPKRSSRATIVYTISYVYWFPQMTYFPEYCQTV